MPPKSNGASAKSNGSKMAESKVQKKPSILHNRILHIVCIVFIIVAAYAFQEFIKSNELPPAGDGTVAAGPKQPKPPREKSREPTPPSKPSKSERKEKRRPGKNPFALEIPRVTEEELIANATLRTGHHPFVLVGAIKSNWKASNWTLNILKNKIPFEWVDYYAKNMRSTGEKPFLMPLEEAIPKFKQRTGTPKYMQMRISVRGWKRLRKDIDPMPSVPNFWSDDTWIRHCMKKEDGKPDEEAISNFYTTNQWKFLLIGEKGTEMFFHQDHTAATSWQAMIQGRKMWTLCPNSETSKLTVGLDTYNPDYKRHPEFAQALCGQTTVGPGEMVYYPAYMWHHAKQLDTPSIAYTGALVGTEVEYPPGLFRGTTKAHKAFYEDLMQKCGKCWTKGKLQRHCEDISLKWPGAAPPPLRRVCEKFLPACYDLWDEHARSMESIPGLDDFDTSSLGSFA